MKYSSVLLLTGSQDKVWILDSERTSIQRISWKVLEMICQWCLTLSTKC